MLSPHIIKIKLITLLLLLSNQALGQEIDNAYVINKLEHLKLLANIEQKQDSLENLTLKINRANNGQTMPLFRLLDSLVPEENLKIVFYLEWATSASRKGKIEQSKDLRKKGLIYARKAKNIGYEFEYINSLSSLFISLSKVDSASYYNIIADKLIRKNPEELERSKWQIDYRNAMIQELLGNTLEQKKALEKSWNTVNLKENHPNRGFLIFILLDFYRQTNDVINQAKFTELFIQHYNKKKLSTPDYHFPIKTILLKDDSKESLDNLIKINKLSDSLNNLNSLSQTSITLASRLIEIGRSKEAIPYLKNSIAKLNAANYPLSNSGELFLLQKAHQTSGDYKNAYQALVQQKEMEDSLRSSEMLSAIADYEVKYETEKKDAALLKLNFQAEKANQQKRVYLIALLSGMIIFGILVIFFFRNTKQNRLLAKQKKMLETTVDEKNVLLRETHHRVKNSFQIVSSLLYIQSENIKDKEAQAAMKEAQNRVRSMVLIHQRLYSKDQLVGVSTDEYLKDLVKDIFESHQVETKKITYTIGAIPIVLGIETTTSLGLILNELITNVIKHAFVKNSEKGHMHVTLNRDGNTLVLRITDTGQGMPEKIKETSFGIQLITALSKKLKAELDFSDNTPSGTIAQLTMHRFTAL